MPRILIVDDEPMITSTLSTLVEMMLDYEVVTCNNPLEIANDEYLAKENFDMVISDFMMPGLDGLALLSKIIEKQPKIVPILLTGYSDKKSAIKSINELGIYYYLEKPWDNNDLIRVIQNGIEKRHLETEIANKVVVIEKRNHEISRLYALLQKDYNREMDNVLEFVISLSNVIEAKDSYTDGHTRRVADLAVLLGQRSGLSDQQIRNLDVSALIHDIGKVATPETILNKPGRLELGEFEVMKQHPEMGASIIRPISALSSCLDPVLHHHEKLDGSGYPEGLKGEEISKEARIIAVSDIFDALYTKRPYRDALSLSEVQQIILREAQEGKIDAAVVSDLMQMIDEGVIEHIYK